MHIHCRWSIPSATRCYTSFSGMRGKTRLKLRVENVVHGGAPIIQRGFCLRIILSAHCGSRERVKSHVWPSGRSVRGSITFRLWRLRPGLWPAALWSPPLPVHLEEGDGLIQELTLREETHIALGIQLFNAMRHEETDHTLEVAFVQPSKTNRSLGEPGG